MRVKLTCCKIDGCQNKGYITNNREIFISGYCLTHYKKLKKYGDPLIIKRASGENRTKHELYRTYACMISRCYSNTNNAYKDYGGRGIEVHKPWIGLNGFSQFIKDIPLRPSIEHTIDRINNDGNYEPANIKWSTRYEQNSNRRDNNDVVGVGWVKQKNKWMSRIFINDKNIYLGSYSLHEDAVKARKEAEIKYAIYS